jgi:fructokinase
MSFNIIGIGEVLWDILPAGRQLGGAPANFTCHHANRLAAFVCSSAGATPPLPETLRSLFADAVPKT